MDEYRGVEYLKQKLNLKQPRVRLRYNYYEMKERTHNRGLLTPPWLKGMYEATVGWCTQSVDALADRLIFRGFKENSDYYGANQIFAQNNPSILFGSAIKESLIGSCAFVHITHGVGEERTPRLSVLTAQDATGIMDEQTGLLKEGYAVLDRDKNHMPVLEAYYTKEGTQYYVNGRESEFEKNPGSYPLLVPIVYKADSKRPFGHSRITRSSMYLQQFAQNTMERAEITAEFYSFPQKYVSGTDPDIEPMESWKASLSAFLRFDKDEDGDHPVIGQFQQQSMTPYIEQVRMAASMFAGHTGLTLDDLGFVTDNPSSAEAIKAAHETLRLIARKAQMDYGYAFANVGFIAACVRDDADYSKALTEDMTAMWEPIFEPDAAMLSTVGDGAIKINQAIPGYFSKETLRDLTGIEAADDEPIGLEEEEVVEE